MPKSIIPNSSEQSIRRGFIAAVPMMDGSVLGVLHHGHGVLELRWVDEQEHDQLALVVHEDDLAHIEKLLQDAVTALKGEG